MRLLLLLLIGAVTAVEAAGGGAEHAVMAGVMAGDAADDRALDAALGIGRCAGGKSECGDGESSEQRLHDVSSGSGICIVNRERPSGFHRGGQSSRRCVGAFFNKRDTNRVVQFDIAVLHTLREGRITHIREIIDSFDLVQQLLDRDLVALLAGKPPES